MMFADLFDVAVKLLKGNNLRNFNLASLYVKVRKIN